MRDFGSSDNPAVQAQLDRLAALTLPQGRFGLETIGELCTRLGQPETGMPPVFHVAGTNGKGSTCAYLRAILEQQGLNVHVATKPHLVRYNERIRIAGRLIEDDELAALLAEVLDAGEDLAPSFFEVTTAAMFLAFARHPADACVIEVGLGGRFDATNVIPATLVSGIAALGIDHESFLLRPEAGTPDEPLARIAFEKASIAKPGVPLVTQSYSPRPTAAVLETAVKLGAPVMMRGRDWWADVSATGIAYRDRFGELMLPLPEMAGTHQADNAALAVAMLRHQSAMPVSPEAMAGGIRAARWPARLQKLGAGPLTSAAALLDEIWLDGGHNPDAARIIAVHFAVNRDQLGKADFVIGMMANKDAQAFIQTLAPVAAKLIAVPVPGHDHHAPEALVAIARSAGIKRVGSAPDVPSALAMLASIGQPFDSFRRVVIAGSLYLAGEVLKLNRELPD